MAAIGGGGIVPTNWPGLLKAVILVAVIAAASYFTIDTVFSKDDGDVQSTGETTLEDVFGPGAKRRIEAATTARASARAVLTVTKSPSPAPADDASSATVEDSGAADTDGDEATPDTPVAVDSSPAEDVASQAAASASDSSPVEDMISQAAAAAAAAPAARPAPTPKRNSAAPATAPATTSAPAKNTQAAAPLRAWWAEPPLPSGSLAVRYVGAMDRGDQPSDAVAVMFDQAVPPAAMRGYATVVRDGGSAVEGDWQSGRNPALLFLGGLAPGRYTITLKQGLSSGGGRSLARTLEGPVLVY